MVPLSEVCNQLRYDLHNNTPGEQEDNYDLHNNNSTNQTTRVLLKRQPDVNREKGRDKNKGTI